MNEIDKLFSIFNDMNIKYFILRDYEKLENIYNSKDIDLFVDRKDKKAVQEVLKNNDWFTPTINDNKYPHKQYYKIENQKMFKLDFVFGLYYGKNTLKFEIEKYLKPSFKRKKGIITISDENVALYTMLLHIVFDKQCINEKNYNILKSMYEDYKNSPLKIEEDHKRIIEIIEEIINNGVDETNEKISIYKKEIKKLKILNSNIFRNCYIRLKILMFSIFNKIYKVLCNRTIAIIGVDGSGKSTSIDLINKIYDEKSKITYMGLKEFKIKVLYKMNENRNGNVFYKLIKRVLFYFEMLIRALKSRFSPKVIIYDRYVNDFFINSSGMLKKIDILFYKILFPRPKMIFYFYCSGETSLKRKDDIPDEKAFLIMKEKYDKYFSNDKKAIMINTDVESIESAVNIICDNINKKFKQI